MSYFLTTQTGFSALPLDCLREIFSYLDNDMKSLYCCMLVNRTWCRLNTALLWCRPFEYSGSKSTSKYFELIRTYIACLPKSAKMKIYETGYEIPSHPRPLFRYHEYLKELDCDKLSEAVDEWIENFEFDEHYSPDDPEEVIYTELLKLFFSRCKGLWSLRLGQYNSNYHIPPIATFPRIKYTLTSLRKFEFLGELDSLDEPVLDNLQEFLLKLSNISNNLEYINVDITEDNGSFIGIGLRKLIASQKNLSFLRYNQESSHIKHSKEFVKALSHNANTLKNVEFDSIPLNGQCLDPLKKFNNLECMRFSYCYEKDIFSETEEIVEHSPSQLKVEKLIFHKGHLTSVTLEVLRLVNESVKELIISNVIEGLFEVILEYCPNIIYLATAISQKTVGSLEYLSASKIEHLILKSPDSKEDVEDMDIDTKDFQQLGKSLPLGLHHLSLNFNISVEGLSSLLKECRSSLKSLCLKFNITTDSDLNKDEYLKVVTEFAKKNDSLKEFKIFLNNRSSRVEGEKLPKVINNNNIKVEDIFSKDILAEAKLLIPNIFRETQDPFL